MLSLEGLTKRDLIKGSIITILAFVFLSEMSKISDLQADTFSSDKQGSHWTVNFSTLRLHIPAYWT